MLAAILVVAVTVLSAAPAFDATAAEAPAADAGRRTGALPSPAPAAAGHDGSSARGQASPPIADLSPQEKQVSRIAGENGDKRFLMVDKAQGEILVFEEGRPVFRGPALTGAAAGDRIPPKVLTFTGNHPLTADQKVTPAGRFTVRPELDPDYGRVWTINEVHGKDWDIAIHQVYLGTPSEHRDTRIRSPDAGDHHITYGCINVERGTIEFLARTLPRKASVPLYVLPSDDSQIAALFPSHQTASGSGGAAR